MNMILGKKVGMTRVYDEDGKIVPVTVIQAGPCVISQVKTPETDGYSAIQMGFGDIKEKNQKKPEIGHMKKANTTPKRFVKELRVDDTSSFELGAQVTAADFAEIEKVDISGTSKGKGFAGTMKRHNFGGFPASHGCKRKHRAPGSIASHASDAGHGGNLKKGKRMAGHMGSVRVTSKNHKIVNVDADQNLIIVKGPVPGANGGFVELRVSK